jgi:ATP-dependent RNA helicase HelY
VLYEYGYVDLGTEDGGWSLTDAGSVLARIFHESELLVSECLRAGLLDGLAPADLAALVSVFVYEHRSPDDPPTPWFPSAAVKAKWRQIERISVELANRERQANLAVHRAPDPTFIALAYAWVAGEGFAEVVGEEELSGGDFVRTMKQLIDLLRQLGQVAPSSDLRRAARQAVDAAFRDVVADASVAGE